MSPRLPALAIAALLAAASPARADRDVAVNGSAGAGFRRLDRWNDPGPDSWSWGWGYSAALGVSGGYFRPELLRWNAAAAYSTISASGSGREDDAGVLTYEAGVSALSKAPASVQASVVRTRTDFSTEGAEERLGTSVTTSEQGAVRTNFEDAPVLQGDVSHSVSENQGAGAPATTAETTGLGLSASDNLDRARYHLSYDTSFAGGTIEASNYRWHGFDLGAQAEPGEDVQTNLQARYLLRLPTVEGASNPRLDTNSFGTGVQWRASPDVRMAVSYAYGHLLMEAPDRDTIELRNQSLSQTTTYLLHPEWSFAGSLSGAVAEERLGDEEQDVASGALGASAGWSRSRGPVVYSAGASGSIGAAQPQEGPASATYGVGGGAGISGRGERIRGGATYRGNYSTGAAIGWTLSNELSLTADGRMGESVPWHAIVRLLQADREHPLVGRFRQRSGTAELGVRHGPASAELTAGISDGLAQSAAPPQATEDLLLPVEYVTTSRHVGLAGTIWILRGLRASLLGRTAAVDAPGLPPTYQHSGSARVEYAIGLFTASIEDTYTVGGYGANEERSNIVFAQLSRSFGVGF